MRKLLFAKRVQGNDIVAVRFLFPRFVFGREIVFQRLGGKGGGDFTFGPFGIRFAIGAELQAELDAGIGKGGDGVVRHDQPFLDTFPYVPTPISGFDKEHKRPPTFVAP